MMKTTQSVSSPLSSLPSSSPLSSLPPSSPTAAADSVKEGKVLVPKTPEAASSSLNTSPSNFWTPGSLPATPQPGLNSTSAPDTSTSGMPAFTTDASPSKTSAKVVPPSAPSAPQPVQNAATSKVPTNTLLSWYLPPGPDDAAWLRRKMDEERVARGLSWDELDGALGRAKGYAAKIFNGTADAAPEDLQELSKRTGIPLATLHNNLLDGNCGVRPDHL